MRRLALPATLLLFPALLAASSARAVGTYGVSSCNFAPEGANNSWVWNTKDPSTTDHYEQHTNCPDRTGSDGGRTDQEGGLSTTDALGLSNGAPPNTSAGWNFTAPAGTTIAGITYERYLGHVFDSSNYWAPALRADDTIITGESCLDTIENSESCYIGGPPHQGGETKTITGLSAHELSLGIRCLAHTEEQCVTGASQHSAWAALYGATVTLSDPTPPALSTPTGTLWNTTGYKTGTQTLHTGAEDTGGGVNKIELLADGHPIDTYSASCDSTQLKPCPAATGEHTLTVPTTTLTDGLHTITVTATDIAGNQSTASEQVHVANNPPLPPADLSATPTQPGSSTFNATWHEPTNPTTPFASAEYQVCTASNTECSSPATAPVGGSATVSTLGPGTWLLNVWLIDAAGHKSNTTSTLLSVPASTPPEPNAAPTTPVATPSMSTTTSTTKPLPPATQPHVRVVRKLHDGRLSVHIIGPNGTTFRVEVTTRRHGRLIAARRHRGRLSHGEVFVRFDLARRTSHVTITIVVAIGNGPLKHYAI